MTSRQILTAEQAETIRLLLELACEGPCTAELEDAFDLHGWHPVLRDIRIVGCEPESPCLYGVCVDPASGNRETLVTSPIVAIDVEKRWARTHSRLYRLRDPMLADQVGEGSQQAASDVMGFEYRHHVPLTSKELLEFIAKELDRLRRLLIDRGTG